MDSTKILARLLQSFAAWDQASGDEQIIVRQNILLLLTNLRRLALKDEMPDLLQAVTFIELDQTR